MATEAFVNHEVVRWARERAGLTTAEAAERLNVKPDRFEAWEAGARRPTFRQAQILARRFYVPFGYLFLPDPPVEELPLPDLRTRAGQGAKRLSPNLSDVVNDAIRKQTWYREYREQEGASPLPFIGRYSLEDDANVIASNIRHTFGINNRMRRKTRGPAHFLRLFADQLENAGILVLRNGIVGSNTSRPLDPDEFLGFAISDEIAPLVFVNTNTYRVVQIFTLAHEIAHLWIGESGISNPDYYRPPSRQANAIERFCNYVAAETLLPSDEFHIYWQPSYKIEDNLKEISSRFKISNMVALRRALDLQKIDRNTYNRYYSILYKSSQTAKDSTQTKGGGDFYANIGPRNSKMFVRTLIESVAEGRVLPRDAAQLLSVNVNTLDAVTERAAKGQFDG